ETHSTFFNNEANFNFNVLNSSPWTPELGLWYHLALVRTGFSYTFYLNGNPNGNGANFGTNLPLQNSAPFRVGRGFSGSFGYWPGQLDEVQVWNSARSQQDIQSTMNATLTGSEAGLQGYWQFDEGTGTTAFDKTANHNDGV